MRIVLEGVDGAGRTTLAKILADKYGLDICHCTQHDAADFGFYSQTLRKENVVWDRHTVGELIYPKIFDRKMQMSPEDARLVTWYGREVDVRFFVLTADMDVIYSRLNERGNEDTRIYENISYIDHMFKFYAKNFYIPIIDTTKMTLQEIFNLIETPQVNKGGFIHGKDKTDLQQNTVNTSAGI